MNNNVDLLSESVKIKKDLDNITNNNDIDNNIIDLLTESLQLNDYKDLDNITETNNNILNKYVELERRQSIYLYKSYIYNLIHPERNTRQKSYRQIQPSKLNISMNYDDIIKNNDYVILTNEYEIYYFDENFNVS